MNRGDLTRCVEGTPISEITLFTMQYIHPPPPTSHKIHLAVCARGWYDMIQIYDDTNNFLLYVITHPWHTFNDEWGKSPLYWGDWRFIACNRFVWIKFLTNALNVEMAKIIPVSKCDPICLWSWKSYELYYSPGKEISNDEWKDKKLEMKKTSTHLKLGKFSAVLPYHIQCHTLLKRYGPMPIPVTDQINGFWHGSYRFDWFISAKIKCILHIMHMASFV